MADIFDPDLFLGGGEVPVEETVDPDIAQAIAGERASLVTKAGYNTWAEYTKAVGETKAAQMEVAALNLRKLKADVARSEAGPVGSGGMTANTIAQLAQSQSQFDANVAEDRRQFQEKYDYDKAKFNQQAQAESAKLAQNAQQFAASQDLSRGNTLLGLGSRPDTLIKYLYAIRGQQTPQAIAGTTTNLPGYQNIVGQPNAGGTIPSAGAVGGAPVPSSSGAAPASAPSLVSQPGMLTPQPFNMGWQDVLNKTNAINAPGGNRINQLDGTTGLNLGPANPLMGQGNVLGGNQYANALSKITAMQGGGGLGNAPGYKPGEFYNSPTPYTPNRARTPAEEAEQLRIDTNGYAEGGLIPEKVNGIGEDSGQPYTFGEEGTEAVVSNDMLERLMQVAGKVDLHQKSKDGRSQRFSFTLNAPPKAKKDQPTPGDRPDVNSYASGGSIGYEPSKKSSTMPSGLHMMPNGQMMGEGGMNSYAAGGTIGYDPSNVPSLGSQASDFFNDPNLSTVVNRGYNSSPQTPLFPQIGIATGQGQSLIPSMQRLNSLLPSEQSLYAGALQDEFGAQPDDVFSLSKRLAPQVSGLRTPRFAN